MDTHELISMSLSAASSCEELPTSLKRVNSHCSSISNSSLVTLDSKAGVTSQNNTESLLNSNAVTDRPTSLLDTPNAYISVHASPRHSQQEVIPDPQPYSPPSTTASSSTAAPPSLAPRRLDDAYSERYTLSDYDADDVMPYYISDGNMSDCSRANYESCSTVDARSRGGCHLNQAYAVSTNAQQEPNYSEINFGPPPASLSGCVTPPLPYRNGPVPDVAHGCDSKSRNAGSVLDDVSRAGGSRLAADQTAFGMSTHFVVYCYYYLWWYNVFQA